MTTFENFKYERPNFEKIIIDLKILLEDFTRSVCFKEANNIFIRINNIRKHIETMKKICFIRHSIDTRNEFYKEEQNFLDENLPIYIEVENIFYRCLLNSNFRDKLEEVWGKQIFNIAEMKIKTFSSEIIEELIEENKLITSYSNLLASADIKFLDEDRTLVQLIPFKEDLDRKVRRDSHLAYSSFFQDNKDNFDEIYDKLVKVRTKIAKKLGFENFVELGYLRLNRKDYNEKDIKFYRDQVLKELVPITLEIINNQKNRLGIDKLAYYDESLYYLDGNAKPFGDYNFIIDTARIMYNEMSQNTGAFFDTMLKNKLLDVSGKEGKMNGDYCNFINDYKMPYIFTNFNGTSGDIKVLTHESGHAFQAFMSRENEIPEYAFPTNEAAEINSMAMEFICYPWMKSFFNKDGDKYRYAHLTTSITAVPYGALVDEFQHIMYEKPNLTPEDRNETWRELEEKYIPYRDYEDNEFLNMGGFWYRQEHIFESPFYYIDYSIGLICAFQFLTNFCLDTNSTWKDYLKICKAGGSKSFLELLELANLKNPFEKGVIKESVYPLRKYLINLGKSLG